MQKLILLCLVLLLIPVFYNCSTIFYRVEIIHDEFDDYTIYKMQGNLLSGGNFTGSVIALNIQKFINKENEISYQLVVIYVHSNWLFIKKNESLILLIDGERIGFSGEGSSTHREVLSTLVREIAYYEITKENLIKLINAKEIKVKIIGDQYYVERYFSEDNFNNFKNFFNQYILEN